MKKDLFEVPKNHRGITNLKYYVLKKHPFDSAWKNLGMSIYLLYFRYSVEMGVAVLTYPEAILMNFLLCYFIFALFNKGSRIFYQAVIFLLRIFYTYYQVYHSRCAV